MGAYVQLCTNFCHSQEDGEDRETIAVDQVRILREKREKEGLKDFNPTGDDVKKLSNNQMKKLNRFQKFEHKFPFYQMDVNGYIFRIKEAMAIEIPGNKNKVWLTE